MHDDGPVRVPVGGGALLDEGQHRERVVGHAVVGPVGVVVLQHVSLAGGRLGGGLGRRGRVGGGGGGGAADLGVADLEGPDGVGGLDVLVGQGDLDEAKGLGRVRGHRPVQVALALQDKKHVLIKVAQNSFTQKNTENEINIKGLK